MAYNDKLKANAVLAVWGRAFQVEGMVPRSVSERVEARSRKYVVGYQGKRMTRPCTVRVIQAHHVEGRGLGDVITLSIPSTSNGMGTYNMTGHSS